MGVVGPHQNRVDLCGGGLNLFMIIFNQFASHTASALDFCPLDSSPTRFYVLVLFQPNRGAFRDRHERWVGMQWTRGCVARRAAQTRTQKSCGPGAPGLALSLQA